MLDHPYVQHEDIFQYSMYVDDILCQSFFASNSRGASAVVSSQIGHRQTALLVSSNTLEQNPVSLMFNFTSVCYC